MNAQQAYTYAKKILGQPQSQANGKIYWTHEDKREIAYCENCKFIAFRKKSISIYVHFDENFENQFDKIKLWYDEIGAVQP